MSYSTVDTDHKLVDPQQHDSCSLHRESECGGKRTRRCLVAARLRGRLASSNLLKHCLCLVSRMHHGDALEPKVGPVVSCPSMLQSEFSSAYSPLIEILFLNFQHLSLPFLGFLTHGTSGFEHDGQFDEAQPYRQNENPKLGTCFTRVHNVVLRYWYSLVQMYGCP